VRRATNNASDLESQLSEMDAKLRASEIARNSSEEQLSRAMREAAEARAENRQLIAENSRLRREVEQASTELTGARQRITSLESQFTSASSRIEEIERRDRENAEAESRRRKFADLQAALTKAGTVKPTSDGFVLVLSDAYFVAPNQTALGRPVKAKMDALGEALRANPEIVFTIEGHSDARANAEAFALGRAQSVADYIAAYNVPRNNFRVESRGASAPASSGKTVRARALNRRVEIVFVSPDKLDRN